MFCYYLGGGAHGPEGVHVLRWIGAQDVGKSKLQHEKTTCVFPKFSLQNSENSKFSPKFSRNLQNNLSKFRTVRNWRWIARQRCASTREEGRGPTPEEAERCRRSIDEANVTTSSQKLDITVKFRVLAFRLTFWNPYILKLN